MDLLTLPVLDEDLDDKMLGFFKGVGEWVEAVLTFCVVGEDSPEVIPIPVSLLLLSILFFSEIFKEHALFTIF